MSMKEETSNLPKHFTFFSESVDHIPLPEKFTFPFYYDPHPLCLIASKELQEHLQTQEIWHHNFGLEPEKEGLVIGKMFGVLIVKNQAGQLGYLSAFSGKLAGGNHHDRFVPPVFDLLEEDGFFRTEERHLTAFNKELDILEVAPEYLACKARVEAEKERSVLEIASKKQELKTTKKDRKARRNKAREEMNEEDFLAFQEVLRQESIKGQFFYKELVKNWEAKLKTSAEELAVFTDPINSIRVERRARSSALQRKIFEHYNFLNIGGEFKNLIEIFKPTRQRTPIAGAGECAAPKLLQYAFEHQLKPIAIAEFWWGQSPKSEIRKHGQFYPACRGKCEPILGHMLDGMVMDENPMLSNPAFGKILPTVYEDDQLLLVNKPTEFLSVPGKNIRDSVSDRMKIRFPDATGPLVVHRLDMSTSGLMLVAKSAEVHKYLQYQFMKRFIKKRYVAVLEGVIEEDEGVIDLPLRVDLMNRPRQLVCYEHGKSARTFWKVMSRTDKHTRIHFFPITGRTHQLRVHAAHPLGLNAPILGDDLYGNKVDRLHLHAASIEFTHPVTKEVMKIELEPDF